MIRYIFDQQNLTLDTGKMSKIKYIFLLFFCIPLMASHREITAIVGERMPLLSETKQKSKFSFNQLNASFSYHILRLPKQIEVKIVGKLFGLDDEKIKKLLVKEVPQGIPLKYFYQQELYGLLQSGKLGNLWDFDRLRFRDLSQGSLNQLPNVLEHVENDVAHWCCCNDLDRDVILSEKGYKAVSNFAKESGAHVSSSKLCCCCNQNDDVCALCLIFGSVASIVLPIGISWCICNPTPCYIATGGFTAITIGWGLCRCRAGGGFRSLTHVTKNR